MKLMTQDSFNSAGIQPPTYTPPKRSGKRSSRIKREGLTNILSTVAILLIAPIIALVLTSFVFQSYQVDGPSMQSTLHNNDRLIVWKAAKTWSRITGHPYIPKRGDVIVFSESILGSYSQSPGRQLIKRVIGLPGERVVIKNNIATVYNKQYPDGFQPDQTLPYGSVITKTSGNIDLTIPKGEVYVMGDNRPDSLDSRVFGPVDVQHIVGKLVIRLWPAGQVKTF